MNCALSQILILIVTASVLLWFAKPNSTTQPFLKFYVNVFWKLSFVNYFTGNKSSFLLDLLKKCDSYQCLSVQFTCHLSKMRFCEKELIEIPKMNSCWDKTGTEIELYILFNSNITQWRTNFTINLKQNWPEINKLDVPLTFEGPIPVHDM